MKAKPRTNHNAHRMPAIAFPLVFAVVNSLVSTTAYAQTTLFDPINDASGFHDITSISGGYTHTNMILTANFRAGTLHPNNLGFTIGLDTDLNASTGTQPPNYPVGQDFSLFFNSQTSATTASLSGIVGPAIPVSFSTDSFSLSIPLSRLGNDDGIAKFCFLVGNPLPSGAIQIFDFAPDTAGGGALGGPTTFIPEPSTMVLAGLGIVALLGARGWHRQLVVGTAQQQEAFEGD